MRVPPSPLGLENENGRSLPVGEEALKHAIALSVALACACAGASARAAAQFEFSQFFATGSAGAMTLTGSFEGDMAAGRISNLTNLNLFRNGASFRGNGALFTFQYDFKTRRWHEGGYLSLDGSANNIMIVDTNYGAGDASFFNYFYSVTGLGTAAFTPSYYRYRVAKTTELSVRLAAPVAAPVPEPSAWALLVLGFGALGAAMRRRRWARPRAA